MFPAKRSGWVTEATNRAGAGREPSKDSLRDFGKSPEESRGCCPHRPSSAKKG